MTAGLFGEVKLGYTTLEEVELILLLIFFQVYSESQEMLGSPKRESSTSNYFVDFWFYFTTCIATLYFSIIFFHTLLSSVDTVGKG